MYPTRYFRSKKDLQNAIQQGQIIGVLTPGFGPAPPTDGSVVVHGPQQGQEHLWSAKVTLKGGRIILVF